MAEPMENTKATEQADPAAQEPRTFTQEEVSRLCAKEAVLSLLASVAGLPEVQKQQNKAPRVHSSPQSQSKQAAFARISVAFVNHFCFFHKSLYRAHIHKGVSGKFREWFTKRTKKALRADHGKECLLV